MSIARHVPTWEDLARAVWKKVFPRRASPLRAAGRGHLPALVPQFLPIAFELVYRETGEARFFEVLRECLYADVDYPKADRRFAKATESLAVVARTLVKEQHRKQGRRIDAVVTLNADDLIEQAVYHLASRVRHSTGKVVRPIARSTHFFTTGSPPSPIPVYHIHGYLPSGTSESERLGEIYEHMLVFTDVQYWSTSVGAMSFANRIMGSALSEGQCVFIGLSMTDINLLRWLALRTIERDRDEAEGRRTATWVGRGFKASLYQQFVRHFWIRPDSSDAGGFLAEFLRLRGVQTVAIGNWKGPGFSRLMKKCFP